LGVGVGVEVSTGVEAGVGVVSGPPAMTKSGSVVAYAMPVTVS